MVRQQLRRARLRRRRLRGLRREEHPARRRRGDRGVHAAALPREGRSASARRPTSSSKAGVQKLAALKARSQEEYELFRQAVAHLLMGLGGEDDKDTKARIAGARSDLRPGHHRRDHRGHAAGGVQPQEPPADRRPRSPTACRSWRWRRTPAATPSTDRRRRTTRIRIRG